MYIHTHSHHPAALKSVQSRMDALMLAFKSAKWEALKTANAKEQELYEQRAQLMADFGAAGGWGSWGGWEGWKYGLSGFWKTQSTLRPRPVGPEGTHGWKA